MAVRLSVLGLTFFLFASIANAKPFPYNPPRSEILHAGQTLKVFVWNVHKFEEFQTPKTLSQLSKKKDLFLLQESMMEGAYQRYFESMDQQQWVNASSFRTLDGFLTGVTTGSRYFIDESVSIRSHALEPIVSTPKMIVLTYLPIVDTQQRLLVANIHGINFVSTAAFATQIEQLETSLAQHHGPILLAGDFNTHVVGRFAIVSEMARRTGLKHIKPKKEVRMLMLDHVFVRGLVAGEARLRSDLNSSDHFPIEVDVTLP